MAFYKHDFKEEGVLSAPHKFDFVPDIHWIYIYMYMISHSTTTLL